MGYTEGKDMAHPKAFTPVKPICGVIYKEDALYEEVKRRLAAEWGSIDRESPAFDFDLTGYYEDEMGQGLRRRFMSFESLAEPETLVDRKLRSINLEEDLRLGSAAAGRPANIDPGYLSASALIMATAKAFSHRVPLGRGIYGHLEFLFTRTGVKVLDWTYPDLRKVPPQEFFRSVRELYLGQLRGRPV
jgi:hypothetical protein